MGRVEVTVSKYHSYSISSCHQSVSPFIYRFIKYLSYLEDLELRCHLDVQEVQQALENPAAH